MKKIKFLLILWISIFAFNINVLAASSSLSTSSSSVYVGDSFTVYANISSAAAWNVHVFSTGPVSGCSINQADVTTDAMDTNKTFSATCTATGEGTITIVLSGDVTSASDGNAVNISGSKSVNVTKKPTPPSNNTIANNNSKNYADNSSNNNIKELSIDGYELVKVDANNYTLSVSNNVTSINVKAVAEDSKAKVSGVGKHDIKVGENNIEVIVTAKNGTQNKINIKVTREDEYYLEDLESVLKNDKITDINIIINSDTKISSQDLENIKNSKKIIKFNYYNNEKNLIYSWIIDGSKLKNTNEILTTVIFDSENKKDILRLSNYADGVFISFKQTDALPNGVKIKVFVGDKYLDNDEVNVYFYIKSDDKLKLIEDKVKIKEGYVEFEVEKVSDYFVTTSNILDLNGVTTSNNNSSVKRVYIILLIVVALIVSIILACILKKKHQKKNDFVIVKDNSNVNISNENNRDNNNINNLSDNYSNKNNQNNNPFS